MPSDSLKTPPLGILTECLCPRTLLLKLRLKSKERATVTKRKPSRALRAVSTD